MDTIIESYPEVSVIMPVYNAEKYVRLAIESILNQTFTNFEFLIFNDGSTDGSYEVITNYTDKRIKIFNFDKNLGLVKQLNEGIRIGKGKYLARMDGDDISNPDRFKRQVEILDANPEIGVCGSWVESFGSSKRIIKYPESDEEIKVSLLARNSLAHPVIMLRRDLLVRNNISYDQEYYPSEDYKMWIDLTPLTDFYNIPAILLKYRITENQITSKYSDVQRILSSKICIAQFGYIGINPSEEEKNLHISMINNNIHDVNDFKKIETWHNKLKEVNKNSGFYDQRIFSGFIEKMRFNSIRSFVYNNFYLNKDKDLNLVKELMFSDYKYFKYLTFLQKIRFFGKLILGK